jgi:multidrug efflux system outer membrane protein
MPKTLLSALLALSLGGCMIGPDYVRPPLESPESWRFAVAEADARQRANAAWWEQFNDPVLNELVAVALRENKDLMIASARIEEYAGRYGITRAGLFPQLGLGADAAKQKNTLPGTTTRGTYNSYDTVLNASWEIDLWGKIRRQGEAARARILASEEGRQGVILSLTASVAGAYINLRDLDRQLEIASRTAASREASYKVFQDRYAGGVISILELSQNKSQYEEALASIPVLEKAIAQQENALSLLLGRNPGPIARGQSIDALLAPPIPAGLPSSLLERRPDLREAEQNLIAANALIGAAKAAYYPSISLTGLFGVASPSLANLFTDRSKIWQYSGSLGLPIFTAGLLGAQLQVAEAQQQQALFSYQKAIQNAFREVNDALIDQDRTQAQLLAQRLQVDALQQYSETARLRYDNGYTSYIEVLDAERSLFNAQLQYTQTQQTRLQAMINLYKAMGGGWETAEDAGRVEPPAPPATEAPAAATAANETAAVSGDRGQAE